MTTPEMKPLLPCPFCGAEASQGDGHDAWIYCSRCTNQTAIYDKFETAMRVWNRRADTRPTPQPSSEYVKALESVAEFANNLWWSIEGEAAGIENDLEAQRVNLKKALEDLNALKSLSAERPE